MQCLVRSRHRRRLRRHPRVLLTAPGVIFLGAAVFVDAVADADKEDEDDQGQDDEEAHAHLLEIESDVLIG